MNAAAASDPTPVLVITMGVSGCGKSTLAAGLAVEFGLRLLEADDFHPPTNVAHMRAGAPLSDAMREPWIAALCATLRGHRQRDESCVLAFSGLRRAHRQRFRELGYPTLFLHLVGDPGVIRARLQARRGHFAPPGLLHSQLEALERPMDEADVVAIDVTSGCGPMHPQAIAAVRAFIAGVRSAGAARD